MNRAVWIFFLVLMFSATMVFAQSEQAAVSPNNEDTEANSLAIKGKKVAELPYVVIRANVQMDKSLQNKARYDAKGGIIVPNASKGIKQGRLTKVQKQLLNQVEKSKRQGVKTKVDTEESGAVFEKKADRKVEERSKTENKRLE